MRRGAVLVAVALATISASALADEAAHKVCATSFEKAQVLRKADKLAGAREQALVCARDACPGFVRDECAKILAEIDASQPTVIVAARDEHGADLVDVRVEVDGKTLVDRLGGNALPIDPGEHTLRFTYDARPPVEQHVVIRVTEKNRRLDVRFPAAPAARVASGPIAPPPSHRVHGPVWPGIVVAGAGVAVFAVSLGLGLDAQATADNLRRTCAPGCAHGDVSAVDTELVVSDILFVTGIVAAAAGVALVIWRPGGHEAPAATMAIGPTFGGAAASLHLVF